MSGIDWEKMQTGLKQLHGTQQNTGSPPLAGQPQSVTGVNPQQAALTGANTPNTTLPASASGGGATGAQTPVVPNAQESQAGAGNPPGGLSNPNFDPSVLVEDRGDPITYMATNLPDRTGTAFAADAAITAGIRVNSKIKDEESAKQVASVSEQMGIKTEADADSLRNMFGDKFKEVTKAKVETGEITPSQKKKQDKQFTTLFGGMTRQELGLFLFEYGSIMMANGDKGLGGAAGMGGVGALAGLQERRRYASQAEIDAAERQRKADLEERKVKATERTVELAEEEAERAKREPFDFYETNEGIFPPKLDKDGNFIGWDTENPLRTKDGEIVKPWSASGDSQYSWQAQQRDWASTFPWMSEEDIKLMTLTNVNPLDVRARADSLWMQLANRYDDMSASERARAPITVNGKSYTWPLSEEARLEWYRQQIRSYGFSEETARRLGGMDPSTTALPRQKWLPEGVKDEAEWKAREEAAAGGREMTPQEWEEFMRLEREANAGALGDK